MPIPKEERRKEQQVPSKFKFLRLENIPLWPDVPPSRPTPHIHPDPGAGRIQMTHLAILTSQSHQCQTFSILHLYSEGASSPPDLWFSGHEFPGTPPDCRGENPSPTQCKASLYSAAHRPSSPLVQQSLNVWSWEGKRRAFIAKKVENGGSWAFNDQPKGPRNCSTVSSLTWVPSLAVEELTTDGSIPRTQRQWPVLFHLHQETWQGFIQKQTCMNCGKGQYHFQC